MIESNLLPGNNSCLDCNSSDDLNPLVLWFKNRSQERSYRAQSDSSFKYYVLCAFGLFLSIAAIQIAIIPV